jgi:hypothetical protein
MTDNSIWKLICEIFPQVLYLLTYSSKKDAKYKYSRAHYASEMDNTIIFISQKP